MPFAPLVFGKGEHITFADRAAIASPEPWQGFVDLLDGGADPGDLSGGVLQSPAITEANQAE